MSQLKIGDNVDHYFRVVEMTEGVARNTKKYADLNLKNRYIQCGAKIWNWDEIKGYLNGELTAGSFIKITGTVGEYQKNAQINIRDIILVDEDEVDMSHLVEVPLVPVQQLEAELRQHLSMIQNPVLKEICDTVLDDRTIYQAFITKPAASRNHHATQHGLLEHTVSMMKMAVELQKQYHFLSLDLLLAGVLWHDLGKIIEINNALDGTYSTSGNLLGHISIAISLLDHVWRQVDLIDDGEVELLKHMILSHHGKKEWGSPVKPAIPEAEALHMLDMIDATFYKLFRHMKDVPTGEWVTHPSAGRYFKHSLSTVDEKEYYRS